MVGPTKTIQVTCQSPGKHVALKSDLTKCPRLRIATAMNTAVGDFTQNTHLIETSKVRKKSQRHSKIRFFQQAIIRCLCALEQAAVNLKDRALWFQEKAREQIKLIEVPAYRLRKQKQEILEQVVCFRLVSCSKDAGDTAS